VSSRNTRHQKTLQNELRAPVRSKEKQNIKGENNENDKQKMQIVVCFPLGGADCGYGTLHNGM
jgi:hypothetical protein